MQRDILGPKYKWWLDFFFKWWKNGYDNVLMVDCINTGVNFSTLALNNFQYIFYTVFWKLYLHLLIGFKGSSQSEITFQT